MASRPRPSLLNLFDPLLAEAVRVPIPDSPPSTPRTSLKSFNHDPDKENVAPEILTMSIFFNRISRTQKFEARRDHEETSGLLIDVTDSEVAVGLLEEQTPRSSRKPLAEISVEDLVLPVAPDAMNRTNPNKPVSTTRIRAAKMSSNFTPQQTTYLFPAISIVDSAQQDSKDHSIQGCHGASPVLPKNLQRHRGSPRGYLKPPTTSSTNDTGTRHPRSPSLEPSMSLSSMSLGSFHLPDASFDLVNGEISFLLESSLEDEEVNQEDASEKPARETPMIELPSQGLILDESPLGSLDANGVSYFTISANWENGSSPSSLATTPSDQNLAFEGKRLEALGPEVILDSRAPVNSKGPETPLKARKMFSVPAPTKKLRVFISGHQPTASTHVAVALPPDPEVKKERALETSEEMGGPNNVSRGARRIPTAGYAAQHTAASINPKKPLSGSHTVTNNAVVRAPVHPPGASMLRKPNIIPHIQRSNTLGTATSKLAGLEGSHDSMLPRLAVSRLPAPSQRVSKMKTSSRPISGVNVASRGWVSKA